MGWRPRGGVACPHLSRPQTDGACDGPEDLTREALTKVAAGTLGGGGTVGGEEPDEGGSESSTESESSASVDTEITVPDAEGPEPLVAVAAMRLVRAQTAPGGLIDAGEGEEVDLGGLSGLGGRTLSRTKSA